MLSRLRRSISSAHLIAAVALFVSLGGVGAWALPGHNSVKPDDVKKNSLTGRHLKDGRVGPADLSRAARGARAYGMWQTAPGPALVAARNATVDDIGDGRYCVRATSGVPVNATSIVVGGFDQTSATSAGDEQISHIEVSRISPPNCAGGWRVTTYRVDVDGAGGVEFADQPFTFIIG